MRNNKYVTLIFILLSIFFFVMTIFFYRAYNDKECTVNKIIDVLNPNYVFLGDSITDFYDLKEYFGDMKIVNSGKGGNSTRDILNNMEERVYRYNPSKVILLIGVNDTIYDISDEETIENIEKIIKNIKENLTNCEIYVESIYPVNNSDDEKINHKMLQGRENKRIKKLNKEIIKLSKKQEIKYINMYDLLKDEDDNLKLEYTNDGIHLNDDGYKIVTKKIKESIF